jgi:hypothetical protein
LSKTPLIAKPARLTALDTACANADDLAAATIENLDNHPDAEIISRLPGLGSLTGVRVPAEIGNDRSRFTNARALEGLHRKPGATVGRSAPRSTCCSAVTVHTILVIDMIRDQEVTRSSLPTTWGPRRLIHRAVVMSDDDDHAGTLPAATTSCNT